MKSRFSLLSMIVLVALLGVLAACSPAGSGPEQGAAEATLPAEAAQPETVTLFVGPELAECTGVGPQMCMLVKDAPDAEYTFFYNQIEGFTFEPGYEYELLVEVTQVANPPADGSSLSYRLVEVVNQTPVETVTLEGPRWVLVDYLNDAGETVAVMGEQEVTAVFAEGQVAGNASCNSYFGGFTTDGNALTVDTLGSTMMACFPDEVMIQEATFLANLQAAATYTIEGDRLMIANADGAVTLTFVASEPISLTSTEWQAISYNNGNEAVVSLLLDTTITALFGEDGSLSGTAGCNNYTATYTVDGETMTISPAASTMMMCEAPEGIMEQESQFLAALATTATYQIDGSTLTLRTADGAMVANFNAAEAMP